MLVFCFVLVWFHLLFCFCLFVCGLFRKKKNKEKYQRTPFLQHLQDYTHAGSSIFFSGSTQTNGSSYFFFFIIPPACQIFLVFPLSGPPPHFPFVLVLGFFWFFFFCLYIPTSQHWWPRKRTNNLCEVQCIVSAEHRWCKNNHILTSAKLTIDESILSPEFDILSILGIDFLKNKILISHCLPPKYMGVFSSF